MTICTWDWQAIAAMFQAAAIVFAALVAKSTIDDYFRNRSGARKFEIAEEAAHIGATLVHKIKLLRSTAMANNAIQIDIKHFERLRKLDAFDRHYLAPADRLLQKCERLRELGLSGALYFGDEYELSCRRIAVIYEHISTTAHHVATMLTMTGEGALEDKVDVVAAMNRELDTLAEEMALLAGQGELQIRETELIDKSMSDIRSHAIQFVR